MAYLQYTMCIEYYIYNNNECITTYTNAPNINILHEFPLYEYNLYLCSFVLFLFLSDFAQNIWDVVGKTCFKVF